MQFILFLNKKAPSDSLHQQSNCKLPTNNCKLMLPPQLSIISPWVCPALVVSIAIN